MEGLTMDAVKLPSLFDLVLSLRMFLLGLVLGGMRYEVVCIQASYIHVGSVGRIMPGDERSSDPKDVQANEFDSVPA